MNDIFKDLNDKQKEAVLQTEGPVLILAGAGSGKTKALTHRVAYLLLEKKVAPENILAVTFTNKAAKEIQERVKKLIADSGSHFAEASRDKQQIASYNLPLMGTFHSICVKILRKEIDILGYKSSFNIYDAHDSKVVVKKSMAYLNIDTKKYNPNTIKNYISSAKNELLSPGEYEKIASGYIQSIVAQVYFKYEDILRKSHGLDFDDLILKCVELFQKHPKVLEKYQNLFRYILVDEYQDTNQVQYIWTKLLAQKHRNLFVIGDDWQSIYMFRGANFGNILDFEKDYPEATVIKLEQNYRSTKNILDAAHQIIEKNEMRSKKKLWTNKGEGELIKIYEGLDERDEARHIASTIESRDYSESLREYAILYRTNAQSRALEEAFLRSSIPYKIVGGVKFYERKEIKDILAYLKFLISGNDIVSFERSVNMPSRGIGKESLSKFEEFVRDNDLTITEGLNVVEDIPKISEKARKGLAEFRSIIRDLGEKKDIFEIAEFLDFAMKRSGYLNYLSGLSEKSEEGIEGEIRKENLGELLSVASELKGDRNDYSLEDLLEEIALLSDLDKYSADMEAVTLMTVHSAKGLEFKNVFIAGLEEDIFPHSMSMMDPGEMEEERRLMYVAITRAKENLHLTYAKRRMYFGKSQYNSLSRFLLEIPEELLDGENSPKEESLDFSNNEDYDCPTFEIGEKVHHEVFGRGEVLAVNDDEIEVDFPFIGKKTLSLMYAPIKKVN